MDHRAMNPPPYRAGPAAAPSQHWPIDPALLSSTHELAGYAIARTFGVVHGFGHQGAGLQLGVAVGARVAESFELAHAAALVAMMRAAVDAGANALVGVRFEFAPWSDGTPAVLAFGTAVYVEAASPR